MEMSIDWLTLTLLPANKKAWRSADEFARAMDSLRVSFHLDELINDMTDKGAARYYAVRMAYEGINLKLPAPELFYKQGICLEISGIGIDFFEEYLAGYGYTLRMWLQKWRAASVSRGVHPCITKCTRFDLACDDKQYDNANPKLTLHKVMRALYNCEVVSKGRIIGADCSDFPTFKQRYKRVEGRGLIGNTITFGNRKSGCYTRIYDKRIEQLQAKKELPKNLTSWTRCELEFHADQAMTILNDYLDRTDEDFKVVACERIMDKLRFIDRVVSSPSRCKTKRWWKEFLNGCVKSKPMRNLKPYRCALERAIRFTRQGLSTAYTLIHEMGDEAYLDFIHSFAEEVEFKTGKSLLRTDVIADMKYNRRYYEEMDGLKTWDYTTELSTQEMLSNIESQRFVFSQQDYKIYRAPEEYGNKQKLIIEDAQ